MIKIMDDGYIMVNTGNGTLFPAGFPARRRRVRGTLREAEIACAELG
jgi:hypothetical protein